MAPGWIHLLDSKLLGYNHMVNVLMDFPVRWLGPSHRRYFHNLQDAILLGFIVDGWNGVRGAISHLILDDMLTEEDRKLLWNAFYKYNQIQFTAKLRTIQEKKTREPIKAQLIKTIAPSQPKRGIVLSVQPARQVKRGEIIDITPATSVHGPLKGQH